MASKLFNLGDNVFIFFAGSLLMLEGSLGAYMYNEAPAGTTISTHTIYLRDTDIFFIGFGLGFLFMHLFNWFFSGSSGHNTITKFILMILCLTFAGVSSYDAYVFNNLQNDSSDKVETAKAEGVNLAFVGIGVGIIVAVILEILFKTLVTRSSGGGGGGIKLPFFGSKKKISAQTSSGQTISKTALTASKALGSLESAAAKVGSLGSKVEGEAGGAVGTEKALELGPIYFGIAPLLLGSLVIASSSINIEIYNNTGKVATTSRSLSILGIVAGIFAVIIGIISLVIFFLDK